MKGVTFGGASTAQPIIRTLDRHVADVNAAVERLSTGLRINHASDDAAGLAISSTLRANVRVYGQGIRNLNDGISALNIADSALDQLGTIVTRQMELAEQSANGVYSSKQRAAMQKETDELRKEFNRIVDVTAMNGITLLSASNAEIQLQGGYGVENVLSVSPAEDAARTVGTGDKSTMTSFTTANGSLGAVVYDQNRDGNLDIIRARTDNCVQVLYGDGAGGITAGPTYSTNSAGAYRIEAGDINNDGITDLVTANNGAAHVSVFLGRADNTFAAATVVNVGGIENRNVSLGDLNGDGNQDLVVGEKTTNGVYVLMGNGQGGFGGSTLYGTTGVSYDAEIVDLDQDGDLDIVNASYGSALLNKGDGTFLPGSNLFAGYSTGSEVESGDFNHDGIPDIVALGWNRVVYALGTGAGTFSSPTTTMIGSAVYGLDLGDLNDDGNIDIVAGDYLSNAVYTFLGNESGGFGAVTTIPTAQGVRNPRLGDFNNDSILEIYATYQASTGSELIYQATARTVKQGAIDISSAGSARNMLDKLRSDLNRIANGRGAIGAMQARAAVAAANLAAARDNFSAAESRITDADVAEESAKLVRKSINQQIAASLLAHVNSSAEIALQLINV